VREMHGFEINPLKKRQYFGNPGKFL
jgi:hypothetical protein